MKHLTHVVCSGVLLGCAQNVRAFRVANDCESPSLPTGSFHVVIAAYESRNCFSHYLWELGVTNAHVFVYRRISQERPLQQWHGPCGIFVQERLLLPNHGREAAAFHSYVVEHYHNPPLAVAFLHGHGPHAYHTNCETLVGRVRLFYRGLVDPALETEAAEFARHMVTLTRVGREGDPLWLHEQPIPPTVDTVAADGAVTFAKCNAIFEKWSVKTAIAGFSSCCATFILPWDRILWYPLDFYQESLKHAMQGMSDQLLGHFCFEFVVYAWYQEHALTPVMEASYAQAVQIADQYNLTGCTGEQSKSEC